MQTLKIAKQIVKLDEESNKFKTKPYYCSENFPTIGWGFKVGNKGAMLPNMTMAEEDGEVFLDANINSIIKFLIDNPKTANAYRRANNVRRAVMCSIAYQVGNAGLLGFKKMLLALSAADYETAAAECLDSLAAKQAPERFARNANMLRTGELDKYYGDC